MKSLLLALFVVAAVAAPAPDAKGNPVELVVNGVPEGHPLDIGNIVGIQLKDHVDGAVASSADLLHPLSSAGIAESAAVAAAEAIAAEAESILEAAELEIAPSPVNVVETQPILLPGVPSVKPEPEVAPSPVVLPAPVLPEVVPSPIVLPAPVLPEVAPSPIVLPAPAQPEIAPSPIVLPAPAKPEIAPSPIFLPAPVAPEVAPSPIVLPVPVEPEPLPVAAPQIPNGEIYNDGLVQVQVNNNEDAGVFSTLQSWFSVIVNYISNGIQTTQQVV